MVGWVRGAGLGEVRAGDGLGAPLVGAGECVDLVGVGRRRRRSACVRDGRATGDDDTGSAAAGASDTTDGTDGTGAGPVGA